MDDRERVKALKQALEQKLVDLEQIQAVKPTGPKQLADLLKNVNATVTNLTTKVKSLNKSK